MRKHPLLPKCEEKFTVIGGLVAHALSDRGKKMSNYRFQQGSWESLTQ